MFWFKKVDLRIGILCSLMMLCFTSLAQSKSAVVGMVTDSSNNALVAATVVILSPTDSSLVSFAITNEEGSFYMPDILPGDYQMQITYIGYGSFEKIFKINKGENLVDLGKIALDKNSELLQEVVVKAEHVPVSINNDTVLYNAAAFKVRTNDAVEDLLRKLPGIEVSSTGEIKAQGETVNKVLVDGKEFFGNDHKIATRNLPANIVDKVAVYDKKSDESAFSGIDDGQDEKTIDLRLKSDKKVGLFGKMTAGLGQPERYQGKAQLNSFTSKMQLSFIGNANNVNEISFDNDKNQVGLGNAVVVISDGGKEDDQFVNGKNTTLSSGVNFNYDLSSKARLRSSYFYKNLKNNVLDNTKTNYYNGDISFINDEKLDSRLKNLGHNLNAAIELDVDSSYQFRLINRANFGDQNNLFSGIANNYKFGGNVFANSNRSTQNLTQDFSYEGNAVLRKRLSQPGRLWSLNFSYDMGVNKKSETLENEIFDLSNYRYTNQQQNNTSDSYNFAGGFSYTEPIGKKYYLTGYLRLNGDVEKVNKDFFDIRAGQMQNLDALSGRGSRPVTSGRVGANISKQTDELSYNFGLGIQNIHLSYNDNETEVTGRKFWYLLPMFSINKTDKSEGIHLRYFGRVQEPTILQMAPLVDNINPLFIYKGNKNLKPSYEHSLNLLYHKYDSFYFRNQTANINFSYVKNNITNGRLTDQNFVTSVSPINVRYQFSALGRYSYGSPFFIPKTKITASTDMQFYNGLTSINGSEVINNRYLSGFDLLLENKNKKNVDLSIDYGLDFTYSKYQTKESQTLTYTTQKVKLFSEFYLTEDLSIGSDFTFRKYSNEQISTGNSLKFWNIFAEVDLGKKKRWTANLSINDLFNQGLGIFRSATPLALIEKSSSNLGRYGMLSLTYSLSDFKPQASKFPI